MNVAHSRGLAPVHTRRRRFNVLFLCTGNSARSIIAEATLRQAGGTRFAAFSAGSHPTGCVHPYALAYLRENRMPVDGLRSKSWDEFARPGAPELDFVVTVCDNAAGQVCPVWPGEPPLRAHWSIPDPAAVDGNDEDLRRAFAEAGRMLGQRIRAFVSLPLAARDRASLAARLAEIGETGSCGGASAQRP
jgi:arsenate reductase